MISFGLMLLLKAIVAFCHNQIFAIGKYIVPVVAENKLTDQDLNFS